MLLFFHCAFNNKIHKAAGRAIPSIAWYNSCGMEKISYSAIHKAAGLSAAVQKGLWRSFLPAAPIHTQWDIF